MTENHTGFQPKSQQLHRNLNEACRRLDQSGIRLRGGKGGNALRDAPRSSLRLLGGRFKGRIISQSGD
jgi:hypothetical protein